MRQSLHLPPSVTTFVVFWGAEVYRLSSLMLLTVSSMVIGSGAEKSLMYESFLLLDFDLFLLFFFLYFFPLPFDNSVVALSTEQSTRLV